MLTKLKMSLVGKGYQIRNRIEDQIIPRQMSWDIFIVIICQRGLGGVSHQTCEHVQQRLIDNIRESFGAY